MVQSLRTPTSVTSIDLYRSSNRSQQAIPSQSDAPKRNRNRGVILSQKGWQKLVQAEVLHDQFGRRYTHEQLSERSLLDVRTISRLLSCEVKVDKSTMRTFFRAFDLQLDVDDYITPIDNEMSESMAQESHTLSPDITSVVTPELIPLVEEVIQLKHHLIEECDRLLNRLGVDDFTLNTLQKSN